MFTESAELYDAIYAAFKDYRAEAARVAALIRALHPEARTVLDVGCGTGEHARLLTLEHGFAVDGLDLDAGLLRVARRKLPDARFFEADMADFSLGRRYDAVICLFSSIGYLLTTKRVTAALRRFHTHLAPGGVVIVEPWFAPDAFKPGPLSVRQIEVNGVRVERTSHATVEGRVTRIVFEYTMHDATGTRHATELHELGLFTRDEMLACFAAAGLEARHDPAGLTDRGLYVARAAD